MSGRIVDPYALAWSCVLTRCCQRRSINDWRVTELLSISLGREGWPPGRGPADMTDGWLGSVLLRAWLVYRCIALTRSV